LFNFLQLVLEGLLLGEVHLRYSTTGINTVAQLVEPEAAFEVEIQRNIYSVIG
jgi:hypothetical protein